MIKCEVGSPHLSTDCFKFQIERDKAHAWFLTEWNDRRILIRWTFIEDKDGTLSKEDKREEKKILPCLFSRVEAERKMDELNAYLKAKQEKKDRDEKERYALLLKREKRLRKGAVVRLEHLLKGDICVINDKVLSDADLAFGEIGASVVDNQVKELQVSFNDKSHLSDLKNFAETICSGAYGAVVLENLICGSRRAYGVLKAFAKENAKNPNAVFDLVWDDDTQSLTFMKREKKEDEETKKRRLAFGLEQALESAKKNSVIAAKDMVPYLEGLGLQKVLETVFFGMYGDEVSVEIPFEPYLKNKKDEWTEVLRKLCSVNSEFGSNEVHIVGGGADEAWKVLSAVKHEVNACASVQSFLDSEKEDVSFWMDDSDSNSETRKKDAAEIAKKFKDYPNQIPLAILTALGKFGHLDPKTILEGTVNKAVEGLNQRILEENDRKHYVRSFSQGTFKNNLEWDNEALWRAPAALGYSVVLVDGDKLTFCPSYEKDWEVGTLTNIRVDKAKEVFPKSLARRMLWIKKTIEKREGAEDKVTYAVDFDTTEDFEKDVPLEFETVDVKNEKGEVSGKRKQLTASEGSLMYLRYSLDPKAFLEAFLSEQLQDDEKECGLELIGVSNAEASFFDALQAMCDEKRSSGHKISIGYGSADNSRDAEMQKLVNDRFDPLAKTYVVYKGKGEFRYADDDELDRFEGFKRRVDLGENPGFDEIEDAKRKWFEDEADRMKEAEREKERAEREKAKAALKVLADNFNAGGEITVTKDLIKALGAKDVVDVVKLAVRAGRVTVLTADFENYNQLIEALRGFVETALSSGHFDLVLKVNNDIPNLADDLSRADKGAIQRAQADRAEQLKMSGGVDVWSVTKYYLVAVLSGKSHNGVKFRVADTTVSLKALRDQEREAEEKKEQALRGVLSGAYTLQEGLNAGLKFEDIFAEAYKGEAVRFSSKNIDWGALDNALKSWFTKYEHWDEPTKLVFKDVSVTERGVWERLEKLATEIVSVSQGRVFMHLDRMNGRVWFEGQKQSAELPQSLEIDDSGSLKWTDDLKQWWWNYASLENLAKFTDALAELVDLVEVDFTQLHEDGTGNITAPESFVKGDGFNCYRSPAGLKQLAKCSGVQFVLPCPNDDVDALKGVLKGICGAVGYGLREGCRYVFGTIRKQSGVFAKSDGTLLWNACARGLVHDGDWNTNLDPMPDEDGWEALGEVLADAIANANNNGAGIKSIRFAKDDNSGIYERISLWIAESGFWKGLHEGLKDCDGFRVLCGKMNEWIDHDGDDMKASVLAGLAGEPFCWKVGEVDGEDTVTVQKPDTGGNDEHSNPNPNDEDPNLPLVTDKDTQKFFGKTKEEIDQIRKQDKWVCVRNLRNLARSDKDVRDAFINCVKEMKLKRLDWEGWKPAPMNQDKLKALAICVFKNCPEVEKISTGVKIIEDDDPNYAVRSEQYESGEYYYIITRKDAGVDDDDAKFNFANVLTETNAQAVWNACLEELKDRIPNYESENILEKDAHVKPVFSDLVSLYDGDVGGKCKERIANQEEIKKFLLSIKDWSSWNGGAGGYLAGEEWVHENWNQVKKIRVLSLYHWKAYQVWRFKAYFIEGADALPLAKLDPKDAYAQMGISVPDDNLVDPIDDDDDDD